MRASTLSSVLLLTLFLHPVPSLAVEPVPVTSGTTDKGEALMDQRGMALYTFAKDRAGRSACSGSCAAKWPPMYAAPGAKPSGHWSLVEREDGRRQWAYKGQPLYSWAADEKAGVAAGDGVGGLWHVARP